MTLFDSTMEYLVTNPDPHNFYMFKEITDLYNCKGKNIVNRRGNAGIQSTDNCIYAFCFNKILLLCFRLE